MMAHLAKYNCVVQPWLDLLHHADHDSSANIGTGVTMWGLQQLRRYGLCAVSSQLGTLPSCCTALDCMDSMNSVTT